MTAPSSIDPTAFLHEQLAQASPDLLRQRGWLGRWLAR
jgi:putative transposase